MKLKLQTFVIFLCNYKDYLCNYKLFGFVKLATGKNIVYYQQKKFDYTLPPILILYMITSERAQRAERVLSYLREKSEYSRPDPARPGPITLFKVLYLRNRMSDRQAGFFDEYHLDVKVVWHGYHIASVPVMARGACQTWGTLDDPQNILPQ